MRELNTRILVPIIQEAALRFVKRSRSSRFSSIKWMIGQFQEDNFSFKKKKLSGESNEASKDAVNFLKGKFTKIFWALK
jgi:hypothetical protein